MSMPRHAARRDSNEQALISLAERLGWWLTKLDTPCDFLGCRRGVWFPIEIKRPERENHADEFTPQQKIFHVDAFRRGARVLVWRTESDVMADSGARPSA